MGSIFRFVFLHCISMSNMIFRRQWHLTGYSVPLTKNTRTTPRTTMGSDFRKTERVLVRTGEVRYESSFKSGMAETTPCENTKPPTPRSIWTERYKSINTVPITASHLGTSCIPMIHQTSHTWLMTVETQGSPLPGCKETSREAYMLCKSSVQEEAGSGSAPISAAVQEVPEACFVHAQGKLDVMDVG
jgi:hypothetical protein